MSTRESDEEKKCVTVVKMLTPERRERKEYKSKRHKINAEGRREKKIWKSKERKKYEHGEGRLEAEKEVCGESY